MTLKRFLCTVSLFPFLLAVVPASPSFREIKDPAKRRQAFVEFVGEKVEAVNTEILEDRARVISLYERSKKDKNLNVADAEWLKALALTHKVDFDVTHKKSFENLLLRVDMIPVSLALAQAANESGWGTSRFAVAGNNFFGHFCKQRGCGMLPGPKGRENASEAKKFVSAFESVKAYVYNLNSHKAYEEMRRIRGGLRKDDKKLDGILLADGLKRYSTRGNAYVRDIKKMMKTDVLERVSVNS